MAMKRASDEMAEEAEDAINNRDAHVGMLWERLTCR